MDDDIPEQSVNIEEEDDDFFSIDHIKSQYMPKEDEEKQVKEFIKAKKQRKLPPMLVPGKVNGNNDEKKCLIWNLYGRIFQIDSSDDNSIEVFFNDSTVHENFVIDNTFSSFEMANMSNNIVALASKSNGNGESELHVRNVTGWHRDSQIWSTTMPEKEVILAVVAGGGFVAVLTDMSYVRLYTANGVKRKIISVVSPIFSMVAFKNTLALVRMEALIEDKDKEDYHYRADMYNIDVCGNNVIEFLYSIPLALSPESELQWISFSNWGHLISMDSLFVVRLMEKDNIWCPVFMGADHLKDAEDSIFPIALSLDTTTQLFRYIYLKNRIIPSFKKTELVTSTPLAFPIENSDDAQSKLESELMINELLSGNGEEGPLLSKFIQQHSALIVKLFAIVCQKRKDARGEELARMARHKPTVQLLANYAGKHNKTILSQKIVEFQQKKAEMQEEYPTTSINTAQNQVQRKVLLKRRPTSHANIETSKQQDENDVSMNISLNASLNVTTTGDNTSEEPVHFNPFKKNVGMLSPSKKKPRSDFFDTFDNLINL